MPNVIVLKGDPIRHEVLAGGTITPGDLVGRASGGTLVRHATAGGNSEKLFAVEMDLIGSGITDDYSSGDTVKFIASRAGDWVYATLASGQNVAIGAFLESDGSGSLQAYTQQSGSNVFPAAVVAVAVEAVDNSSGSTLHDGAARIKVEVI